MELAIVLLKVLGVVAFLLAMLGVAVCLIAADECRDSPDGAHHFVHERTDRGWFGRCEFCGRLTSGIDAFARKKA